MSESGIDLSCILRSLQATDDTTWSKHIVLKAIASVEERRPITRTHVIHLSDDTCGNSQVSEVDRTFDKSKTISAFGARAQQGF